MGILIVLGAYIMSSRIQRIRSCRSTNDLRKVMAAIAANTEEIRKAIKIAQSVATTKGKAKMNLSLSAIDSTTTIKYGDKGALVTKGPGKALPTSQVLAPGEFNRAAIKLDLIDKHTGNIQALYENQSDQSAIAAKIRTTYPEGPEKKKLLAALQAMNTGITRDINHALSVLHNLGLKYLPKPIEIAFDLAQDLVIEKLDPKSYNGDKPEVLRFVSAAPEIKTIAARIGQANERVIQARAKFVATNRLVKTSQQEMETAKKSYREDTPEYKAVVTRANVAAQKHEAALAEFKAAKEAAETFSYEELQFSCFLRFKNMKTASGWVMPEFCVVLTASITNTGVVKYYLNGFPDFVVPGKYPIGKEVSNKKAIEDRIDYILAHNDIAVKIERRPMPLNNTNLKGYQLIPGVSNVQVRNDRLLVSIDPKQSSDKAINKAATEVMSLLFYDVNKMKGGHAKNVPQYMVRRKAGLVTLEFIITGNKAGGKDAVIDNHKMDQLQNLLGLTDTQVSAVKKALVHVS